MLIGYARVSRGDDQSTAAQKRALKAAGRMMMQMVGSFAEFERAMIRERTSAGLAEARAAGRIGGRRAKLTSGQRTDIVENVLSGRRSAADMARLYKVSEATISRTVASGRVLGLVATNSNEKVF